MSRLLRFYPDEKRLTIGLALIYEKILVGIQFRELPPGGRKVLPQNRYISAHAHDYYQKGNISENPWVAVNLYKAFCKAKEVAVESYFETAALRVALVWIADEVDRTRKVMGEDWGPYGISKNQKVLETFLRYHYEQGLSEILMKPEELFAPETLDEEYKI